MRKTNVNTQPNLPITIYHKLNIQNGHHGIKNSLCFWHRNANRLKYLTNNISLYVVNLS